jgi:hypothetical protein
LAARPHRYSTSWSRVMTVFSSARAGAVPAALKTWWP